MTQHGERLAGNPGQGQPPTAGGQALEKERQGANAGAVDKRHVGKIDHNIPCLDGSQGNQAVPHGAARLAVQAALEVQTHQAGFTLNTLEHYNPQFRRHRRSMLCRA